jgi:hypothetical protein
VTAVLSIALLVMLLVPTLFRGSLIALRAGIGVLVATLGFQVARGGGDGVRFGFGYGSTIGFVAAGIVCLAPLASLRPPAVAWNRVLIRLAPIAACLIYLVVVVLPWWNVLPRHIYSALRSAPLSWLTITGVLAAIWLLRLWMGQVANGSANTHPRCARPHPSA